MCWLKLVVVGWVVLAVSGGRNIPNVYHVEVERLDPRTGEVETWGEWKGVESVVRVFEGHSEMINLDGEDRKRKPGERVAKWGGSGVCVTDSYSSVLLLHDLLKGVVVKTEQSTGTLIRGIRSETYTFGQDECGKYLPVGYECRSLTVNLKTATDHPLRAEIEAVNVIMSPPVDIHHIYHLTGFVSESFKTEHFLSGCREQKPTPPYLNEYKSLLEWVSGDVTRYIMEKSTGMVRSRDLELHSLEVLGTGSRYVKDSLLNVMFKEEGGECGVGGVDDMQFPLRDLVSFFSKEEASVVESGPHYMWSYEAGGGVEIYMVSTVPTTLADSVLINLTIDLKKTPVDIDMWGVPVMGSLHHLTPAYIDVEPLSASEVAIPSTCPTPSHNLTSRVSQTCFKTCCTSQGWEEQTEEGCYSSAAYVAYIACSLGSGAAAAYLVTHFCKK